MVVEQTLGAQVRAWDRRKLLTKQTEVTNFVSSKSTRATQAQSRMEATRRFTTRLHTRPPTPSRLRWTCTRHRRWPRPQPRQCISSAAYLHKSKRHGSLALQKPRRGRRNPLCDHSSIASPLPDIPSHQVLLGKKGSAEEFQTRGRWHGADTSTKLSLNCTRRLIEHRSSRRQSVSRDYHDAYKKVYSKSDHRSQ